MKKQIVILVVLCVASLTASSQKFPAYQGTGHRAIIPGWLTTRPRQIFYAPKDIHSVSIIKKNIFVGHPQVFVSKPIGKNLIAIPLQKQQYLTTGFPLWTISKEVHRIDQK